MVRIVEGMEEIGLAFESDQLITKVCKMDGNGVEMWTVEIENGL